MTWHDPKEVEPPKNRAFLAKVNHKSSYGFEVLKYQQFTEYITSQDGFPYKIEEIEKWCEIPDDN